MTLLTHLTAPQPHLHDAQGRFDILGDVHGMAAPLLHVMKSAGWVVSDFDPESFDPIVAQHPQGRHLVFAGDLVNKGPDSILVLRLLLGMRSVGAASAVLGNHEDMLLEAIYQPRSKPAKSIKALHAELSRAPIGFRVAALDCLSKLGGQIHLPMPPGLPLSGDGFLTVLHAGAKPEDIGRADHLTRKRTIHGRGLQMTIKRDWANRFEDFPRWIVHGHTPRKAPHIRHRVIGLDTDAVAGGQLTMLHADTATFRSSAVNLAQAAGPAQSLDQARAA